MEYTAIRRKVGRKFKHSTIHGISHIPKRRVIFIKLFWLVFFLICLALSITFLVIQLNAYYQYETVIKVTMGQSLKPEFPAVTICNINPLNNKPSTIQYISNLIKTLNETSSTKDFTSKSQNVSKNEINKTEGSLIELKNSIKNRDIEVQRNINDKRSEIRYRRVVSNDLFDDVNYLENCSNLLNTSSELHILTFNSSEITTPTRFTSTTLAPNPSTSAPSTFTTLGPNPLTSTASVTTSYYTVDSETTSMLFLMRSISDYLFDDVNYIKNCSNLLNVSSESPITTFNSSEITTLTPSGITTSIPSGITTSTPSEITTSTPSGITTSTPSEITTSTPSGITTSTPSEITTSTPSGITTSTPSEITTSTPSGITTSTPSEITTSTPSGITTSTPSEITTSIPSRITTSAPSEIITSTPTLTPGITTSTPSEIITLTPSGITTSIPSRITTSAPSEITTSTTSEITTSTPSGITTSTPSEITTSTPSGITTSTPSEIITLTPSGITTSIPSRITTSAPSEIITSTASGITTSTRSEITTSTTSEITTSTPSGITTSTPSEIITLTPSGITTSIPSRITTSAPSEITTSTTSEITTSTPSGITTSTPSEITTSTPSEITTSTPSEIITSTPSGITTSTPSEIITSTPSGITTSTPSGVTTSIPSGITTSTPSEITTSTPSEITTSTPSEITTSTPSEIITSTTSEITTSTPSGITTSIPSESTTSTSTEITTSITSENTTSTVSYFSGYISSTIGSTSTSYSTIQSNTIISVTITTTFETNLNDTSTSQLTSELQITTSVTRLDQSNTDTTPRYVGTTLDVNTEITAIMTFNYTTATNILYETSSNLNSTFISTNISVPSTSVVPSTSYNDTTTTLINIPSTAIINTTSINNATISDTLSSTKIVVDSTSNSILAVDNTTTYLMTNLLTSTITDYYTSNNSSLNFQDIETTTIDLISTVTFTANNFLNNTTNSITLNTGTITPEITYIPSLLDTTSNSLNLSTTAALTTSSDTTSLVSYSTAEFIYSSTSVQITSSLVDSILNSTTIESTSTTKYYLATTLDMSHISITNEVQTSNASTSSAGILQSTILKSDSSTFPDDTTTIINDVSTVNVGDTSSVSSYSTIFTSFPTSGVLDTGIDKTSSFYSTISERNSVPTTTVNDQSTLIYTTLNKSTFHSNEIVESLTTTPADLNIITESSSSSILNYTTGYDILTTKTDFNNSFSGKGIPIIKIFSSQLICELPIGNSSDMNVCVRNQFIWQSNNSISHFTAATYNESSQTYLTSLPDIFWKDYLNNEIYCLFECSTYLQLKSEPFYFGLYISISEPSNKTQSYTFKNLTDGPLIIVDEGKNDTILITVNSNVPNEDSFNTTFSIQCDKELVNIVSDLSCAANISKQFALISRTFVSNKYRSNQTINCTFNKITGNQFINTCLLPQIKINYVPKIRSFDDGGNCHNNLQCITNDGTLFQIKGLENEYLAYQNKYLHLRIQITTSPCEIFLNQSCIDKIEVQAIDEFLIFNLNKVVKLQYININSNDKKFLTVSWKNGETIMPAETNLKVIDNGYQYLVVTQYGTIIAIDKNGFFFKIIPSKTDFDEVDGILGNWNHDSYDDFVINKNYNASLYMDLYDTSKQNLNKLSQLEFYNYSITKTSYCSCLEDGGSVCADYPVVIDDILSQSELIIETIKIPESVLDLLRETDVIASEMLNTQIFNKATNNLCSEVLSKNFVLNQCHDLGKINLTLLIDYCNADFLKTGLDIWEKSYLRTYIGLCKLLLEIDDTNLSFQKNKKRQINSYQYLINQMCLNNCNGNGDCVNGSCVCYTDYASTDCSIYTKQRPTLITTQFANSKCNHKIYLCSNVLARGTGLADDNIINVDYYYAEDPSINVKDVCNGTLRGTIAANTITDEVILAYLPLPTNQFNEKSVFIRKVGFKAWNAKDESLKSNCIQFYEYFSNCHRVDSLGNLVLKDFICVIDLSCFNENELNPSNASLACKSAVSQYYWTYIGNSSYVTQTTTKANATDATDEAYSYILSAQELICNASNNTNTCLKQINENVMINILAQLGSLNNQVNTSSLLYTLGYSFKESVLNMIFNKKDFSKYPNSSINYFWHYRYGNCYTAHPGQFQRTVDEGDVAEFIMELYTGNIFQRSLFTENIGMHIFIHNKSTPSYYLNEGFDVFPGSESRVNVFRTFKTFLSQPYSNCIDKLASFQSVNSKLHGYITSLNLSDYDQAFCYKLCFQDRLIDECKCADYKIPILKNVTICSNSIQLNCQNNLANVFATTDNECTKNCPLECQSIKYDWLKTYANYPSKSYTKFLKNAITDAPISDDDAFNYFQSTVIKLVVTFKYSTYNSYDELPSITLEQIFGNIGGNFGIFIGVSMLSLIEVIEIIIDLIILIYKKK